MSQQQEELQSEDGGSPHKVQQNQQQQQPQAGVEGHGGQGSESAMKQMRIWEQGRATNSGGKRKHPI